jgi:hypothetical protein
MSFECFDLSAFPFYAKNESLVGMSCPSTHPYGSYWQLRDEFPKCLGRFDFDMNRCSLLVTGRSDLSVLKLFISQKIDRPT